MNLLVVVTVSIHFRFVVMSPQMSSTSSLHVFVSSERQIQYITIQTQYKTIQNNTILTNTIQFNSKQHKCLQYPACFHVLLHVPKQTVSWHHNRAISSVLNWLYSVPYFPISFVMYSVHSICLLNLFQSALYFICFVLFALICLLNWF